jgi:hypothetical protein
LSPIDTAQCQAVDDVGKLLRVVGALGELNQRIAFVLGLKVQPGERRHSDDRTGHNPKYRYQLCHKTPALNRMAEGDSLPA